MVLLCFLWFLLVFLNGESNKRRLAECEPFLFSVNLSICQGGRLFHHHFLVITKVDALRQTGDVCTYVLAIKGVDLVRI